MVTEGEATGCSDCSGRCCCYFGFVLLWDGSFASRVAFGLTAPRHMGGGDDFNIFHVMLKVFPWKLYLVVANISRVEHCGEKALGLREANLKHQL